MIGADFHLDQLSDECLKVLSSYSIRELASRKANVDANGWLDRIEDVPGIDRAAMTMIHGMLIAQGMLKFEITGRSVGLQYQVSSVGRDALARHYQLQADELGKDENSDPPIQHADDHDRSPATAASAAHSGDNLSAASSQLRGAA